MNERTGLVASCVMNLKTVESMEDYETDKKKLIAAVLQNRRILIPLPDSEMVRMTWDEETQSVKQEIIPISDLHKH